MKKYFEDPEARAQNAEAQKIAQGTPEMRKFHSDVFWRQDPETRAKMLAAMGDKERRRAEKVSKAKSAAAGK